MRPMRRSIDARLVLALFALVGCASPIVGAECREGWLRCDDVCVDVSNDPANCGGCGVECPEWAVCSSGACVVGTDGGFDGSFDGDVPDATRDGSMDADATLDGALEDGAIYDAKPDGELEDGSLPDGALPDGALPDGALPDGALPDGALPDGALPDGALPDGALPDGALPDGGPCGGACTVDQLCCGGACVDPSSDDAHCGGCGNACATIEECVASVCEPICAPPTTYCDGLCVLTDVDPDHCGACNRRCPTGLCSAGMCIDASPGHVVLVGHSYDVSRLVIRRVVGNAVWLANAPTIDVGVYEGDARPAARNAVDRAIDETSSGRVWNRMPLADVDALTAALGELEVVLVHAQRGATDADLLALGASAGPFLRPFVAGGGVVVVLDGGGSHAGTWQVLAAAGLLDATSRSAIGNVTLDVVSPTDAVATGLPFQYRAETESVSFGSDGGADVVVRHGADPVVLHRVVTP
ncbi:MAG: hypothetical protein H6722_19640 [Sandaracinus sp.]|nr:hypothetical protein [Sandaracinus sp.]